MEDYRLKLEPLVQEYVAKHKVDVEALRVKVQPLVEELRVKVVANVEIGRAHV